MGDWRGSRRTPQAGTSSRRPGGTRTGTAAAACCRPRRRRTRPGGTPSPPPRRRRTSPAAAASRRRPLEVVAVPVLHPRLHPPPPVPHRQQLPLLPGEGVPVDDGEGGGGADGVGVRPLVDAITGLRLPLVSPRPSVRIHRLGAFCRAYCRPRWAGGV